MATVTMMAYPVRDNFPAYSQQYAMYHSRSHQPHSESAQTMQASPYTPYGSLSQPPPYHQQSSPRSVHSTASSGSEDGFKPSLPSISNLLGIADRPTSTSSTRPIPSPIQQQFPRSPRATLRSQREQRAPTSHPSQEIPMSPRSVAPAPPSVRNDSVLGSTHSPSASSSTPPASGPSYFAGSSINNVEPADQRAAHASVVKRSSIPSQPNTSPYGNARFTTSPYATSPSGASASSYYSPTAPSYPPTNSLYQQRPLPSNFPPPPSMPAPSPALPTSNPWEHHHYISPSSQATFPQSQDRYICPTCNKAFSRPSSLKIHSHSHTGEKPFRCPHAGCGKAFSVRSNMKRHERGCHSGLPALALSAAAASAGSPQQLSPQQ